MTVYATLQPRMYSVLVAPYQRGMEGPFTIHLWSNYEVALRQMWPPPKGGEAKEKRTLKEKVAQARASGRKLVAGKLKDKLGGPMTVSVVVVVVVVVLCCSCACYSQVRGVFSIFQTAEEQRMIDEADAEEAEEALAEAAELVREAQLTQEMQEKSAWVEQYDPTSDRTYYYNMETGESQWEVPTELRPEGIGQGADAEKVTYENVSQKKKKKKKKKQVRGAGPT